jgi:hypothetical protein
VNELTDLPEWVWNLLDALAAYEDEHPILYRLGDSAPDGAVGYERASCFGHFLSERKAWPPRGIQNAAEFRRHVMRAQSNKPEGASE